MRNRLPFVLVLATMALVAVASPAQAIVINEFRMRGLNGVNDEFIELANETSSPVTVSTTDGSAGWAVAATGAALGTARARVRADGRRSPRRAGGRDWAMREETLGLAVLSRVRLAAERVSFATPFGRSAELRRIAPGFREETGGVRELPGIGRVIRG